MKKPKSVSLVAWAYNEEELIGKFLRKAIRLLRSTEREYELIIVDDGSTDGTGKILKKYADKNSKIRILTNKNNRNVGYSCRRGIFAARHDIIFWQTVDWSYDISRLQALLCLKEKFDVVAGVRRRQVPVRGQFAKFVLAIYRLFHIRHLTRRSDTVYKAVISIFNYCLIRLLFGFELSDYQNVVFYPKKFIQKVSIISKSSFMNPELLLRAHYQGLSICEAPISFLPRKSGKSKGTKIFAILSTIKDLACFYFILKIKKEISKKTVGKIHRLR